MKALIPRPQALRLLWSERRKTAAIDQLLYGSNRNQVWDRGPLAPGGRALDGRQFRRFASEIARSSKTGIPVSSSAVRRLPRASTCWVSTSDRKIFLENRPVPRPQPELMRMYATAFKQHGVKVAQLLLTHDDIDSRMRRQNASNTSNGSSNTKHRPGHNENDTVAVEELRFGDNDRLSEVAQLVNANLFDGHVIRWTDGPRAAHY